jgi:hypothetical protein
MSKIYNNHVFQRSTKPWQWIAIISFSIAILSSVGAFLTARSWLGDGRYLQAIDIDQIEVLRLIPALKDLQQQVSGTHALDSEFFNNLRKADRLLRSMTDDVKVPTTENSSAAVNPVANSSATQRSASTSNVSKLQNIGNSSSERDTPPAPLSDNPALAFFQKLDSKIMKILFGKPDKYADSAIDEPVVSSQLPEQKSVNAEDIQDILVGAKTAEQSISIVLSQEKSLAGLDILAKSAEALISAKGALELDKIPADSPAKKYAESLAEFVKANAVWQKNITSSSASTALQKALVTVIDQKVLIEIEAGKKTSGKSTLSLTQAMPKVHQSPWHSKLPQESAAALKLYTNNVQAVREFASDHEALRVVALKNSKGLRLFDFGTAGGFLGLSLLSVIALIGVGLGGGMWLKNSRIAPVANDRAAKLTTTADALLGSIDLNLGKSEIKNTEEVQVNPESKISVRQKSDSDPSDLTQVGTPELKTVVNVISELSQDLRAKVTRIEERMKVLAQVGNKLRHSVSTLQDKSAQMRFASNEQAEGVYDTRSGANRGGPLEQLQDAFFALKQQGVRLYLAILDNHSSKQLAVETEQLNLLVERIEATVSKMRASLAQALDQVTEAQTAAPQVSPEVIELINMDAKQVMRDLDLWQEEFDGLSHAFIELKRDIKV